MILNIDTDNPDVQYQFIQWLTFRWSGGKFPFKSEPRRVVRAVPVWTVGINARTPSKRMIISDAICVLNPKVEPWMGGCGVLVTYNQGPPGVKLLTSHTIICITTAMMVGYFSEEEAAAGIAEQMAHRKDYDAMGGHAE